MSNITSLLSAIEGLSVSDGVSTPTCLNLTETPGAVDSMDTPVRILLPQDDIGNQTFEFISLGQGNKIDWHIEELYLCMPVAEGRGWKDVGNKLYTYIANFAAAVVAARSTICGYEMNVMDITPRRGTWQWGDRWYYGVRTSLTVREFS